MCFCISKFHFSKLTTIDCFKDNTLSCWTLAMEFLAAKIKRTLEPGILACKVKVHFGNSDERWNLNVLSPFVGHLIHYLFLSFNMFKCFLAAASFYKGLVLCLTSYALARKICLPLRTMEASILLFRLTTSHIVPPALSVKFWLPR